MGFFANLIKKTFPNEMAKVHRARRLCSQWTAQDQSILECYSKFVSPGSLCFDVGANVGNRVKIFLKLQATVVAVEPQDECMKLLKALYGSHPHLTLLQKVLGESEGNAELMVSNTCSISSLSPEWINAVKQSGRFAEYTWDRKQTVAMTTLDRLIEQYGVPAFIKVDVEGFEYPVVKGLSRAVKTLSLEFTPEYLESTFDCLRHLEGLGDMRLNYALGETMQFALAEWVTAQEMIRLLSSYRSDNRLFGDVYVQYRA